MVEMVGYLYYKNTVVEKCRSFEEMLNLPTTVNRSGFSRRLHFWRGWSNE